MVNSKNTNRKFKGFTLIELSVVITILGVLAAILVPAMMGWVEKSNNATDAENARIICNAIQADCIESSDYESYTRSPWYGGGQKDDDHGYVYVDKREVRCSSYKVAQLLEKQGFIASAAKPDRVGGGRTYTVDGTEEEIKEYVYVGSKASSMLCKSKKTWYRYQVNIFDRNGTIEFAYSALAKDTEHDNDTDMSSKTNKIDRIASENLAKKAGMGYADEYTSIGPEYTG